MSAVVLAPIAVGAVYLGGVYFYLFMAIATAAMAYEWCHTSFRNNKQSYVFLVALWLLFAIFLNFEGYTAYAFISLLLCAGGLIALSWFRREEREWKGAFLGPLYIGIPVLSLLLIREDETAGILNTLTLFFIVWATDTGAYFAGRAIGGPKIAPSISPNKTWAGLIGGMICAALVLIAMNHSLLTWQITPVLAIMLGMAFAVLAQIGDFFESGWKRYFDVKDASNLIPGHGGVLDRLDGVLFVAPALYLLLRMIEG